MGKGSEVTFKPLTIMMSVEEALAEDKRRSRY